MLEAALASFGKLGLIVVDKEGNRLWQYDISNAERLYGLGIDPASGNIYYGTTNKIIEVTRLGNKVWEFSDPQRLIDIHTIDVIGPGRLLVTSCFLSKVLEVDKKRGVVQEWDMGDYFGRPPGFERKDWMHVNWVKRTENGGLLITTLHGTSKTGLIAHRSEAMRIDASGKLVWRWYDVSDRVLFGAHALVPFRGHYLISESGAKQILEVDEEGKIYKTMKIGRICHEIEVIDQNRILVACVHSGEGDQYRKSALFWIDWDEEEKTMYEPPEDGFSGGYSVKYVPNWSADPTPEEEEVITERLRKLGYV